ncbi:MAG: isocitrate lyase/PEP mutase family protein [Hyphomicrobiales bacterium]
MTTSSDLRSRLLGPEILIAPGVYDGLSALMAEQAGAEALYVSGASIAYTRFGRPDVGLVTMSEVADTVALICDRVGTPVIVDADNGYGNAINVQRSVRTLERLGAGAIQLEDQHFPKKCGHLAGKELIGAGEMAGKIQAAVDARRSADTLVIARTDAISAEDLDAALDRARAYSEAGADVLFVEAPQSDDELRTIVRELGPLAPLMANMVEGGRTPDLTAAELQALGFRLVIFPGGLVRAQAFTARKYFDSLLGHGSNGPFRDTMLDFQGINEVVGTDDVLKAGARYARDDG